MPGVQRSAADGEPGARTTQPGPKLDMKL